MGTDINFRKHLNRTYGTNVSLAFDPMSSAYFVATGITGYTQQTAIDKLVKGLKQDGLWSKMKAVYPFVTDNRNLFGYTEQLNNTSFWGPQGATVTANTTTAPNGTLTADSLIENTANTDHYIGIQSGLTLTAVPYTMSVYLKKAGRDWCNIGLFNGVDSKSAWFNLNTGTIGTINSGITANIESVGNGWYRCSITRTMAANSNNYIGIGASLTDGSIAYLGNGSTSIYVWGAQLELGSTATTYQPIATTQQAFISNQFKYNLVNPVDSDAAFRLVFNGGWTHSANGATPNGTNGWANTYLQPSSVLTQNSTHLSFYSRTQDTSKSGLDISSFTLAPAAHLALTAYYNSLTTGISVQYLYPTDSAIGYSGSTQGLFIGSRINSTSNKLYRNAAILGTRTTANTTFLPTNNIAIAANGQTGSMGEYQNRQCAFASIGNGLTDTEASNLYTRVQAFQNSLNRAVI